MILYVLLILIFCSIVVAVWVYVSAVKKGRKLRVLFIQMDLYFDRFLEQCNETGLEIGEIMCHSLFGNLKMELDQLLLQLFAILSHPTYASVYIPYQSRFFSAIQSKTESYFRMPGVKRIKKIDFDIQNEYRKLLVIQVETNLKNLV